jgi:hypothetical protein
VLADHLPVDGALRLGLLGGVLRHLRLGVEAGGLGQRGAVARGLRGHGAGGGLRAGRRVGGGDQPRLGRRLGERGQDADERDGGAGDDGEP